MAAAAQVSEASEQQVRLLAADATGLLKALAPPKKDVVAKARTQDREKRIVAMTVWQDQLFCGTADGHVEVYEDCNPSQMSIFLTDLEGLVDLDVNESYVAVALQKGQVKVYNHDGLEQEDFTAHTHVNCLRLSREKPSLLAVGGEKADLRVWDLDDIKQPKWRAKNVKNDKFNLQVPIDIRGIRWVNATQLITVSAHRHVRLYDTSEKARPLYSVQFNDAALSAV
ncbi:uncharacterized protein MONBRDRAFT_37164, partial [Monosiga brevicollis MX1]